MNCLLFAACMTPLLAADPIVGKGDPELQGTWIAHDRNPWKDGKKDTSVIGRRLTFSQGKFTITNPEGKLLHGGTFTVGGHLTTERGTSARAIQFVHADGQAKGQIWLGIYSTCHTLRITDNSSDPSKPRPPDYHPKQQEGHASVGYSRTGQY